MIAANLSVSVDGYFTGPGAGPQQTLGQGGEVLHGWFAHDVADRDQLSAADALRPELERAGALDELQLHVVPVLLTQGRWLWEDIGDLPIELEPVRTLEGVGVTHLKYRVRR
ncbi:hypothetical protein [Serinicoccus marinus]|uniref:hypothetical protein n=1 Tax=Serinicoccus marinus TaxID=247333 RepID=UPI0003B6373D|nr:hypothetical protein [Serinicoccus marinus]